MDKAYFRVLDLFCGAGGFSSGIDQNPHFETLLALDFEQAADTRFDTPSNGTNSHPFRQCCAATACKGISRPHCK